MYADGDRLSKRKRQKTPLHTVYASVERCRVIAPATGTGMILLQQA